MGQHFHHRGQYFTCQGNRLDRFHRIQLYSYLRERPGPETPQHTLTGTTRYLYPCTVYTHTLYRILPGVFTFSFYVSHVRTRQSPERNFAAV